MDEIPIAMEEKKMETEKRDKIAEGVSSSGVYKTPFSFIILLEINLAAIPVILVNLWYYSGLYYLITGIKIFIFTPEANWWFWLLLPLNIYGNIFLFFLTTTLISLLFFKILNKMHPPQEGRFKKGSRDWKYMHRRFWTAYFPIWLARALPFPWADIIVYRLFGVKIGKSVVAYEGYIDPLLIEIGDSTMTSLHICIFSHLLYHDEIYIRKVTVGNQCVIGPHSILSPGTIIEDGAVLGATSFTKPNQLLKGGLIWVGSPATTSFPISDVENDS
ncbi:MAG: Acetyltransferase [Promethearchaeota archaeon]|nr:MAG: Acetyltransferase [Candidatus Lokiarchaeota archaeon]